MGIYFTSDLHIGHDKDFIYKPRGFNDVFEMDNAIIKNFNEVLKYDDTLYILGDIVMGGEQFHKEWNRVLNSLPCAEVYYIIGNHDTENKCEYYDKVCLFQSLGYAALLKVKKYISIYLSHYPTITENFDDDKTKHYTINLFGHTHSKDKFYNNNRFMYNVAVDAHNCYPVEINQIFEDIKNKGQN
jgi:calcineurin-like phosphoesterase family protein